MWHVTGDTWQVTRDTWHVTRDTWYMTRDTWHVLGGWTFSQHFSSLALTDYDIMKIWRKRMTHWINDEAVYRTAPATPGLLIRCGDLYKSVMLGLWRSVQGRCTASCSRKHYHLLFCDARLHNIDIMCNLMKNNKYVIHSFKEML